MEAALHIPAANTMAMVTTLIISVGVPIALCVLFKIRYKASIKSFFIGCGIFVFFALMLEQILHLIVLGALGSVSETIAGNIWLYALYGSLAAAVFEETGRFVAMKVFMKERLNKENAMMYGAGHGGIEAMLIVGISYISNLLVVFMVNSGAMTAVFEAEGGSELYNQVSLLATVPASQFYMAGIERLITIAFHIALSLLVYMAVKVERNTLSTIDFESAEADMGYKHVNKKYCFALAVAFHFIVNFVAVVMASKMSLWAVEAVVLVLVAGVGLVTYKFYKEDIS